MELLSGDEAARWAALGFTVSDGDVVRVGAVAVRCDGSGEGLRGWVLPGDGGGADAVDGIPTSWGASPASPPAHANGASSIDHVVVFTDSRDRTAAALVEAGGDERRRIGPPSVPVAMAFVRVGSVIVEVAEHVGAPRLWGLVAVVDDLDALCASTPEGLLGTPRDAVQPGRRIVTVQPAAGLGTALAFMTPRTR